MTVTGLMLDTRFWGIFWIDASSDLTASEGFLDISRVCGIDADPKAVRRWLSNTQDSWLLIIDNADDPSINVSNFFPTGNRGSILLTTRNPACKIHSTIGSCELGQLTMDDAVTLLLKATGAEDTADETSRTKAIPITKTIGFLAIAIVQAGSYIRQGLCGIDEYCELYTRCRQRLLEYLPTQQSSEYKYSVYTNWEISVEAFEKMCTDTSRNAIDLLRTFCFFHYDGILEEIFERAWSKRYELGSLHQDITHMFYMQSREEEKDWDPVIIRELEVKQRILGSEHPDTLGSMDNLAYSYSKLGRVHEAMELGEKALEAWQRALGSEHPGTLRSMNNLAIIKRERGKITENRVYRSRSPSSRETTTRRATFKAWLKRF